MSVNIYSIVIIRKDSAMMSRTQSGNLMDVINVAQGRRKDFPEATIRIVLEGHGVLHSFEPLEA